MCALGCAFWVRVLLSTISRPPQHLSTTHNRRSCTAREGGGDTSAAADGGHTSRSCSSWPHRVSSGVHNNGDLSATPQMLPHAERGGWLAPAMHQGWHLNPCFSDWGAAGRERVGSLARRENARGTLQRSFLLAPRKRKVYRIGQN